MNPKKKSVFRELIMSPVAIAVLLFLFVIIAKSVFVIVKKNTDVHKEMRIVREKQVELQKKHDDLKNTLSELDTEEGRETEIRDKFFVVKPGEQIIVITEQSSKNTEELQNNTDGVPWWRRLFRRSE